MAARFAIDFHRTKSRRLRRNEKERESAQAGLANLRAIDWRTPRMSLSRAIPSMSFILYRYIIGQQNRQAIALSRCTTISLHFLKGEPWPQTGTSTHGSARHDSRDMCALRDVPVARKWRKRIYISLREGGTGERESEMTREIYSESSPERSSSHG